MKTKLLVWVAFVTAIAFNSCNQEEIFDFQEESPPETEEAEETMYADAEKVFRLSMEMSTMALPTNVSQIEVSPTGAINANGETRLAIATGSFTSAILLKAQDLALGEDLATGTITGNGMIGYTSLTIPAYKAASSYPSRVIGFFFWGSTGQWELFHFDTQAPNGDGGTVTPPPPILQFSLQVSPSGIIPATGTTVNVTLTGNFTTNETDYMYVRAYSPTTGQQISSSLGYFRGTSQKLTSLSIKANTFNNELSVLYQYSLDDGKTWITFHTTTQAYNKPEPPKELPHVELPDGGLVALYDAPGGTMTWTQAIGIDDSYLYKGHDNPDNRNRQSGCYIYSERADGRDRGLWRVPCGETAPYIQQAYQAGKFAQKGVSISTGDYWCSRNTATTGYTYRVTRNGLDSGTSKTAKRAVRCVIHKSLFNNL